MSKYFNIEKGVLSFRRGHEMIRIEGWGNDALRIRTTENKSFTSEDWALSEKVENNPSEPKYVHTKWGVGYYYIQK